jgi:ribosome-associated translation inhibitor RaiA
MKVNLQAVNFNVDKKLVDFVQEKIDKLEKDMQNWKEMLHQFGIANCFEPPVETSESPAPEKKATKKK